MGKDFQKVNIHISILKQNNNKRDTMSAVQADKMNPQELALLACSYAALILHDEEVDITPEKINQLLKAAGLKIESYWAQLLANVLKQKNIGSLLNASGSGSEQTQQTQQQEKKDDKKPEQKKDDKPKPEEKPAEEAEVDMGGLFD
eukprot:TRINITY_DN2489_c0_g1_i1.p2 TRINITY_DN2489_c0_g1~~TRINITY_DN2489_c0_g1_i1.p2  ORF type:complete len:146 (-),score=46.98 TRINITY_DN2489_c0_g1_i1:100-537(-)